MLDRILSYIKGTQSNFNKGNGKRGEYEGIDEEKVWEVKTKIRNWKLQIGN